MKHPDRRNFSLTQVVMTLSAMPEESYEEP